MVKLLINKIFSLILSAYFAALFIYTENVLFMSYSIITIVIYFIFDHFLYTQEIQKQVDKVLNYIFFYLDTDSQKRIFLRNKHIQVKDLVNIWFLVEVYTAKRYKSYYATRWRKTDSEGLLNGYKATCLKEFLSSNKLKFESNLAYFTHKKEFIGKMLEDIEKEAPYQEIFSLLDENLKSNDHFLNELDLIIRECDLNCKDSKESLLKNLVNLD